MSIVFKAAPTNKFNPWANKAKTGNFWCHNYYTVWESGGKSAFISLGVRRSEMWQFWPIWRTGNNCQKSVMFGFWKLYFEIGYKK